MKLARWIFGTAGVYGILVIAPLYFAEGQIARNDPPAITHPGQRVKAMTLAFGCIDLLLGALFVLAFFFTPRSEASA